MVEKVTINYLAIQSLFEPGGDVYRFMRRIGTEIKTEAEATAPVGLTGNLKRSHRLFVTPETRYGCFATVRNDARHASWVHNGTASNGSGYIFPKRAARLGPFPGLSGVLIMPNKVRGQRANPWLNRAGRTVMSRYGVAVPPAPL